jgi:hypothetical protein
MGNEKGADAMNRIIWKLVDLVSRMLEPNEKQIVLGDYTESGEAAAQVLIGVTGLVIRRQFALWKEVGAWLSLLGIVGLVGIPLSQVFLSYDNAFYERAWGLFWGHPVNPFNFPGRAAVVLDIAYMTGLSLALALWSWSSGFVLGFFSGRTTWLTGTLFYFMVLDFAFWHRAFVATGGDPSLILSPVIGSGPSLRLILPVILDTLVADGPMLLFIVLPAGWGARQGLRNPNLGMLRTYVSGAIMVTLTIGILWMARRYEAEGVMRAPGNLNAWSLVLLNWPIAFMVAAELWRSRRKTSVARAIDNSDA